MAYIVRDGSIRKEFGTLKEAVEFRKDKNIPIYESDNFGNLKSLSLNQISERMGNEQSYAIPVEKIEEKSPTKEEKPVKSKIASPPVLIVIIFIVIVLAVAAIIVYPMLKDLLR